MRLLEYVCSKQWDFFNTRIINLKFCISDVEILFFIWYLLKIMKIIVRIR